MYTNAIAQMPVAVAAPAEWLCATPLPPPFLAEAVPVFLPPPLLRAASLNCCHPPPTSAALGDLCCMPTPDFFGPSHASAAFVAGGCSGCELPAMTNHGSLQLIHLADNIGSTGISCSNCYSRPLQDTNRSDRILDLVSRIVIGG